LDVGKFIVRGGGQGYDANFSINFEPSLALSWIVYLPLFVQVRLHYDAKRGEGGGPKLNNIMTLILVWKC
jgi:hypothetical protein